MALINISVPLNWLYWKLFRLSQKPTAAAVAADRQQLRAKRHANNQPLRERKAFVETTETHTDSIADNTRRRQQQHSATTNQISSRPPC